MKDAWLKAAQQVYGRTKDHRGITRHCSGMKRQ